MRKKNHMTENIYKSFAKEYLDLLEHWETDPSERISIECFGDWLDRNKSKMIEDLHRDSNVKKTEWISVENKLPEKFERYLVFEKLGPHAHTTAAYDYPHPLCCGVNIAYFCTWRNGWQWDSFSKEKCNPTHWMPLPKPPKDKE